MVAFGEQIVALRAPGWERHHVDYAALKARIGFIRSASPIEEQADQSKAFFESLCLQLPAASSLTAVDLIHAPVRCAGRRGWLRLKRVAGCALRYAKRTFDAVCCCRFHFCAFAGRRLCQSRPSRAAATLTTRPSLAILSARKVSHSNN